MAINGNNIVILVDGTAVAATKTHKVQTKTATIEKASSTQQSWREYIAGRSDWSIDVNYLVTSVSDIRRVLWNGRTVTIVIRDRAGGTSLTGTAICTQCEQSYARGSLAVGSFSFKGSGPLT